MSNPPNLSSAFVAFLEDYRWEWTDVKTPKALGNFWERLEEAAGSTDPSVWHPLVKAHIKAGNAKVAGNTWVFSLGTATDCPNLGTDRCQVPAGACYAHSGEQRYENEEGGPLSAGRRREVIWDLLDPVTFARTLEAIHSNRQACDIEYMRFNEAGDMRNTNDVHKLNELARQLNQRLDIQVYTYSASSKPIVDWDRIGERHFTLNASNDHVNKHADRRFSAKPKDQIDVQSGERVCPAELHGRDKIQCGECTLCIKDADVDVFVPIH